MSVWSGILDLVTRRKQAVIRMLGYFRICGQKRVYRSFWKTIMPLGVLTPLSWLWARQRCPCGQTIFRNHITMSCVIISGNEDNYSLTCNKRSPKGNGGMTSWHKLTAPHRFYQESITWILQLPCIFVTAFSQTSIFLAWIYCELGLPTRAHRPIKISAWLISNFTR